MAEWVLRAAVIMDTEQLHSDILSVLPKDPAASEQIDLLNSGKATPRWSLSPEGFLLLNDRIYVPDADDLRLRVLKYKHDHILSGHFGQSKTIDLIRREYVWPGL